MREFRMSGSVEGAVGNRRPYSDQRIRNKPRSTAFVSRYTDPNMTLATRSGRGNIVPRWHLRRRRDW